MIAALLAAAPMQATEAPSPYVIRLDLSSDIRDLGSDDPFVADPAADHLVALGRIALPALAAALQHEPPAIRAGVVGVLQDIAGKEAARLLVTAAGDADAQVRAEALLALGLAGTPSAQAAVEAHLTDPDPRAARAAALACHSVCASPAALEQLTTLALRGAQVQAAQQSLRSIVAGRDPARTQTARAAIEAQALPLLADEKTDAAERANAALLAGLIGRREAVPVLIIVMRQAPTAMARTMAAMSLGGIADPSAVAGLSAVARDGDVSVRAAACLSLGRLHAAGVAGAEQAVAACPTPKPTG